MHIGRQFGSELLQSGQRDICNGDVRSHAGSDTGSSLTHRTTAQHQDLGRFDTRHTGHQLALAALGLLQVVGTILCGHASCHLTHRNE